MHLTRRSALVGLAGLPLLPTAEAQANHLKAPGQQPASGPTWAQLGKPPLPLATLRIVNINPTIQTTNITGGGNEDLLIVLPAGTTRGAFQIKVNGFRGVYCIGGDVLIQPWGTLRSPNGRKVAGIGVFLYVKSHPNPVSRPFVYVARLGYRPAPKLLKWPTESIFGDFMQVGGAAQPGQWGAWPDIYRSYILAGPFYGWGGYYGTKFDGYNTFGQNVSHADFIKPETGGLRHLYTHAVDVKWGYQTEFATRPSYIHNYTPYSGPDGHGKAYYWKYIGRSVIRPDLGSDLTPVTFWFVDDVNKVLSGAFSDVILGPDVYCVSHTTGSILPLVKPKEGKYTAVESGGKLTWPVAAPSGRKIATGLIHNGRVFQPPAVVTQAQIGSAHRVTNRTQLMDYINGGYI